MKKKRLILALGLVGTTTATLAAPPIDFSGYMRAGVGLNARGGTQVCYQLPGADTKWRLGNECDYVIEPSFSAKLATFEGADWHVHFMPSVYRAWGDNELGGANSRGDDLYARFGQVYTYGNNISALGNGKLWAGRRFYNRLQLGINDHFIENNDGDGAGLEDMNVGFGKLSVAVMLNPRDYRDPNNADTTSVNDNRVTIPVRLTNVKTNPNGELAVYVTGATSSQSDNQLTGQPAVDRAKSASLGVYHTQSGVLGGNLLVGAKFQRTGDVKKLWVLAQESTQFGATAFDTIAEFRNTDAPNNGGDKWYSIGARTDTYLGGPFRMLVEAGHDRIEPDVGATRSMTKFTLAGAVSAGNTAGSRPTIRLFVTHAIWNDAARNAMVAAKSRTAEVYGDKKSGTSIGIQGETWW